jgi:hypothetical protein
LAIIVIARLSFEVVSDSLNTPIRVSYHHHTGEAVNTNFTDRWRMSTSFGGGLSSALR